MTPLAERADPQMPFGDAQLAGDLAPGGHSGSGGYAPVGGPATDFAGFCAVRRVPDYQSEFH
jgi:hypothetical protein